MDYGLPCRQCVCILLLLITTLFGSESQSYSQFEWVTGAWGTCENTHCGYGGLQHREVWCRIRNSNSVHPINCVHFPKPEGMRECYKKCVKSDVILKEDVEETWSDNNDVIWSVYEWSRCQLAPNVAMCGRNEGVRHRVVVCEHKTTKEKVVDFLCEKKEPKPITKESCELLCRQDCVVDLFSSWSSCDNSCQVYNRTRTRRIVLPPRHGGKHCPPFSEMQPCDNCTDFYTYALEPWEPCRPFEKGYAKNIKTHPLIGYQSRDIKCLNAKGLLTAFRHCSDKLVDSVLHQHQACIIPQDCIVSDWSQLLPLNASCVDEKGIIPGYMIRKRRVLQLPLGDGKECQSNLNEFVKIQGEDPFSLKPCFRTKWILSAWSPCESVPGYSHCGTGIQNRQAICVSLEEDGRERPTADYHCVQNKPLVSQACQVGCNWDCSVSHWSSWSECRSRDCDDYIRKKRTDDGGGKRHRTREVLTLPGPGGNACPHLSETQACEPMACYSLNITLGECTANSRTECGPGRQPRYKTCISRTGERVSDNLCWDYDRGEPSYEDCHVPCSTDCVMSDWGMWSKCPDPCSTAQIGPIIHVRERHILAYNGPGGQPCPKEMRQNEPCPIRVQCAIYYWKSSGWGPCVLDNPNQKCGRGFQQREVTCFNQDGQPVINRRCEEIVRPKDSQTCTIDCPIDCTVSEWAHWSDCGVTCLDVTARQVLPKQRRVRYILQYPENKGSPCPNDLFEERQCLHLPLCDEYRWDKTEWSDCIIPPIVPYCGDGMRARNVTCRHANGTDHPLDTCLRNIGAMPKLLEICHVSCARECQLSDWSIWSVCVGGCNGYSHRTRKLIGESRFRAECKNIELYSLDQREKCLCNVLHPVVIGAYSDCILDDAVGSKPRFAQMSFKSVEERDTNTSNRGGSLVNTYCGTGKKYKVVACRNDQHDLEMASKCSLNGYEEDMCVISCPVDCEMTEWSAWSHCGVTCGAGMQVRFRSIATQPASGGRKCPSLNGSIKENQSRVCRVDCNHYLWDEGEWDSCIPQAGAGCGTGRQIRPVRCQSISETTKVLGYVDDIYCRGKDRPLETRSCYLSCPGECVLSEWTSWSLCKQPCNSQQTQKRTRKRMRSSSQHYSSESQCGKLIEERLCRKGDNCIEYSWEISNWSTCLVNGGYETCGVGHKERYAICRNGESKTVSNYYCEKIFGMISEPLVSSCEIPCDIDCLLSDWSDWSFCTKSCGLGISTRHRTMIQSPIGNGRKCPSTFKQSKPCFLTGCYKWKVSEWSTCLREKGVCGSSFRLRNVTCVGDDGLSVNSSRCPPDLEKLVLTTKEICHVPCPGECMLSDWTSWSLCYINCQDFKKGHRNGVKVRSRAILASPSQDNALCDDNLWEEMPCNADKCLTFDWRIGKWIAGHRTVQCHRSDGLLVEGGCDENIKPQNVLKCDPVCAKHADCIDTNVCQCFIHFKPVYINGIITECIMEANDTDIIETTTLTLPAGPGNIWMYAVIAVGTIFVIAVAAALYNMCELFRTGPRPRKKTEGSIKSDNVSDVVDKEAMCNENNEMPHMDAETNIDKIPDNNSNVGLLSECVTHLCNSKTLTCSIGEFWPRMRNCKCLLCNIPCVPSIDNSERYMEVSTDSSMCVNSLQRACHLAVESEQNYKQYVMCSEIPQTKATTTQMTTEAQCSSSSNSSATRKIGSTCTDSFPSLPEIELDILNERMTETSSPTPDFSSDDFYNMYIQPKPNNNYAIPNKLKDQAVQTSNEYLNNKNKDKTLCPINSHGYAISKTHPMNSRNDIISNSANERSVKNKVIENFSHVNRDYKTGQTREMCVIKNNGIKKLKVLSSLDSTENKLETFV
ncbi:hypothetical protein SNE40_009543 [Patella caerulea]|uniref:Spondin-like TSP1 domain-containing protein n=1 Tax=Patella caerulea TaxID=87958 RepID=A0AAN8PRY3_PATCE